MPISETLGDHPLSHGEGSARVTRLFMTRRKGQGFFFSLMRVGLTASSRKKKVTPLPRVTVWGGNSVGKNTSRRAGDVWSSQALQALHTRQMGDAMGVVVESVSTLVLTHKAGDLET